MKGKIHSIVALLAILILVVTLAPLADTESAKAAPSFDTWEPVTTPGVPGTNTVLACDVNGMAVCPDGTTIFVIDNQTAGSAIWRSEDGGRTFTQLPNPPGFTPPYRCVAVAPDYSPAMPVVAVVDSTAAVAGTNALGRVYASDTGGVGWGALPMVPDVGAGLNRVMDLAVGPQRPGAMMLDGRDFAVVTAADLAAYTNNADIFVIGQTTGWIAVGTIVAGANTFDYTSVAFTPCFLSDRVIVAVGSNATGTSLLLINLGANFGSTATYVTPPGAPVLIQATPIDYDAVLAAANSIISSDIALPSNYAPPMPEGQRTFVGMAAVGAAANTDVFRVDFTTSNKLEIAPDVDIHSISYFGNLMGGYLVAGGVTGNAATCLANVWCTDTPMDSLPTWYSSAKPPTGCSAAGVSNCIVAFDPNFATSHKVFAGTSDGATAGRESAFSVSCCAFAPDCPCACFNQTALIDTVINGMADVMPTPKGTEIFLATWNAATGAGLESLWKSPLPCTAESWDRVRTSPANWGAAGGAIIRLSPYYGTADSTLFWCDVGAINIQYSKDGGCCFLVRNTLPVNITDVTVEDTLVLYAACSDNRVYRSGSAAFSWGLPADAGIGPINTIAMAPTYPIEPLSGNVLVGGTGGEVACSTSWPTFTPLQSLPVGGNVQVAGDTYYGDNSTIYAGSISGKVYRYVIPDPAWEEINPTIASVSGLAVHCGCLYAADATPAGAGVPPGGADRTRDPTGAATWVHLTAGLSGGETFNVVPSALRCSDALADASYVALFAIDTTNVVLYEYIDTEAKAAGPPEGKFIYSVKFLCGKGKENLGVRPARYTTAINIHNFLDEPVSLRKKVVIAHREGEPVGEITEYFELSLGPNEAVEVDCVDIRELLGSPSTAFLKGFVVIESSKPLNIVAVYTAQQRKVLMDSEVSIDVEYILPVVSP